MEAIQIIHTEEKIQVTLDKKFFKAEDLMRILSHLRLEYLAQDVNFNETLEDLGKEIKADWWHANKDQFLGQVNE